MAAAAALAVVMVSAANMEAAYAQTSDKGFLEWWRARQKTKATEKKARAKAKEWTKQGYVLVGSTRTLEDAVVKTWEKEDDMKAETTFGMAVNCAVPADCRTAAFLDAALNYARMATSDLRERAAGDAYLNQAEKDNASEFNKFYNGYENLVKANINTVLGSTPALTLHNEKKRKMLVIFLVSPDNAAKIREKALQQANRETELAQQYANKVSKFVEEGFKEKPSVTDAPSE